MPDFTLTQEQYEALVALAREGLIRSDGTIFEERAVRLDEWLRLIENSNDIQRDFVWVQWQELDEPLPQGTQFPENWPPDKRRSIEFVSRRVAKVDVNIMLDEHARKPLNVLCTRDPGAMRGWTPLDDFFPN